jgi:hypothetical protein
MTATSVGASFPQDAIRGNSARGIERNVGMSGDEYVVMQRERR